MMTLFYIFTFLCGLCVGSFLNALEYRLKHKKNFVTERSICPRCQKQLRWYHNVPVLSFVCLRGKCAFCQKKISWQYPIVELMTGVLFLLVAVLSQQFLVVSEVYFLTNLFWWWFLAGVLIFVFIYDLKYMLILDRIVVPAIVISLLVQVWLVYLSNVGWQGFWLDYKMILFSAIIGGGWFLLLYAISKGKWIGGGDIRLGFLMGIILPWSSLLGALCIAYMLGTIIMLPFVILQKKKMKSEVPFGIFLVPATLAFLFWGERIIDWYFNIWF
jgi:leader peptidase (prepilin peptidase)/N-methyltransferase